MRDKLDEFPKNKIPESDMEIYSAFGWCSVLSVLIATFACS